MSKKTNCTYCQKYICVKNIARHERSCKVKKIMNNEQLSKEYAIKKYQTKVTCTQSLICCYCLKIFSTKNSMYRHVKYNCKIVEKEKRDKQQIYDELKKLKEENKKMKDNIVSLKNEKNTTITNVNIRDNIINTTNNIIVFSFGKEDISKINTKEIINAIKKGFHSTIKLTDTIHFNPKYPEYHNVYIPSMKEKYAMIYKDDNWQLVDKNELVDEIYDNKKEYIEENIEEFYDSMTKSQKNALNRWLSADENNNKKVKDIKEKIKLLLYNKRHIPMYTKRGNKNIQNTL
jgi:hypothetical protein